MQTTGPGNGQWVPGSPTPEAPDAAPGCRARAVGRTAQAPDCATARGGAQPSGSCSSPAATTQIQVAKGGAGDVRNEATEAGDLRADSVVTIATMTSNEAPALPAGPPFFFLLLIFLTRGFLCARPCQRHRRGDQRQESLYFGGGRVTY